jgi:hypothetical protein
MSKRMSQPAAPANTIVTTVSSRIRLRGQREGDPFRHIRSAILKTSQPRAANPTPQRSITETITLTLLSTG